jgi:hypothetical protein
MVMWIGLSWISVASNRSPMFLRYLTSLVSQNTIVFSKISLKYIWKCVMLIGLSWISLASNCSPVSLSSSKETLGRVTTVITLVSLE